MAFKIQQKVAVEKKHEDQLAEISSKKQPIDYTYMVLEQSLMMIKSMGSKTPLECSYV